MVAFYGGAFDANVSHSDDTGAWIHITGGPLILVRVLEDFQPPTWPEPDVPMQMHLELSVDDLEEPRLDCRSWEPRRLATNHTENRAT